jgi:hypothetical protein
MALARTVTYRRISALIERSRVYWAVGSPSAVDDRGGDVSAPFIPEARVVGWPFWSLAADSISSLWLRSDIRASAHRDLGFRPKLSDKYMPMRPIANSPHQSTTVIGARTWTSSPSLLTVSLGGKPSVDGCSKHFCQPLPAIGRLSFRWSSRGAARRTLALARVANDDQLTAVKGGLVMIGESRRDPALRQLSDGRGTRACRSGHHTPHTALVQYRAKRAGSLWHFRRRPIRQTTCLGLSGDIVLLA